MTVKIEVEIPEKFAIPFNDFISRLTLPGDDGITEVNIMKKNKLDPKDFVQIEGIFDKFRSDVRKLSDYVERKKNR